MKWLRLIIGLVVLATVAALVVWRIAFYIPKPKLAEPPGQEKTVTEPNGPAEANEPNKPKEDEETKDEEDEKPQEGEKPEEPNDPNKPPEPNDPMESINLIDVEMKDVLERIVKWTGAKALIPVDDALKKKITIYAPEKVRRSQALAYIYRALREQGIVAEIDEDQIVLRPLKDPKLRSVPTVPDDYELAKLVNKDEIVEKFFKLKHLSPTQLAGVVKPFVPEDRGYVYAIEATSHLVCIDTVTNLLRIQRIIEQLDRPETEETITKTFEIEQADPVEIVQLLNILVGDGQVTRRSSSPRSSRSRDRDRRRSRDRNDDGPIETVVIGSGDSPITLIPWPQRKWIIAKASPPDMNEIEYWVDELDQRKPEEREHELVKIKFADVEEVSDQINEMVNGMPLRPNVTVHPLERARQLMIVGSEENRQMVKKLIDEIDTPTNIVTEYIKLKHADPELIAENIQGLFEEVTGYSYSSRYYSSNYRRTSSPDRDDPDYVRVIPWPTLSQVTVIAGPNNMETIKEQIAEWDKPVDVNEVKPRIITLHNSDPVKMAALLSTLFTEMEQGRRTYLDYIFGTGRQDKKKIVGPLYGKLTFEPVPDTKKIIVISMIPEAYDVVEQIIEELDQKEMAEVPVVVTLKYADPEDLSERLNAIFNEPGTLAKIRLSKTGLTDRSMDEGDQGDTPSGNNESDQPTTQGEYTPWWSSGGRVRPDEMPISNVIGRIRFIPDPRSKAILVLSPPEYTDNVRLMIEALDVPGMQVRIKSIVVEIDHRNLTSLGIQLATDPGAFGTLDENAITALTSLTHLTSHGSLAITAGATGPVPESGDTGTATLLDAATNITALIDFLVKRVDAKILNEQTLWTKDNEEADFFKGQKVAFITSATRSAEGQSTTTNLTYPEIGMIMQVRPRITPEKDVDMTVRLEVSQRTAELINGQPVRNKMRTGTTLIVQDGETIMLGGMLFQEDSTIERRVPLFSDIPLIGGLFRHNEIVKANVETLVFVTPYVIDEDPSKMLAETKADIETEREKLKEILTELKTTTEEAG